MASSELGSRAVRASVKAAVALMAPLATVASATAASATAALAMASSATAA